MKAPAMTDTRRPLHLAVMFGASTALYAVSMAGVASIQSTGDQTLAAKQAPADNAATRLQEGHDALEARLARAADAYARAAAGYDQLASTLETTENALGDYAGRVQAVTGASKALPGRVSLPSVSSKVVVRTTSKPKTTTSTGASGA
jgi:hypothetical protein